MTAARLRIGIIGAGAFVEAAHLPGLLSHPRAQVVALCARRRDAARALADRFGVGDVHADFRELCAREDIDAVTICTPNSEHRGQALAALAAGKHVLCEKPLDLGAPGARAMLAAAERSGRLHRVAFTYRYLYGIEALRARIRRGDIGEPFSFSALHRSWDFLRPEARVGWRGVSSLAGGGVLYDIGSHFFDLARFLLGDVAAVRGSSFRLAGPRAPALIDPPLEVDTDDVAAAEFRFRSGAIGEWRASRVTESPGENQVVVVGREGALAAPLSRGRFDALRLSRPGRRAWEDLPLSESARDGEPHATRRMMHRFVDACLGAADESDLDADFSDGVAVQEALAAAAGSLEAGWVELPGA